MSKIENWDRQQELEDDETIRMWSHSKFPIVAKVLKRDDADYDIMVKRRPTGILIFDEEAYRSQEKAIDTMTSWLQDHPDSGMGFSPDDLLKEFDRQLEKHTDIENARVISNIGDVNAQDGTVLKVAQFGDAVAYATPDMVGGEIYSTEGEFPDEKVEGLERQGKGGRHPVQEAEVEWFYVAEDTAKELGMEEPSKADNTFVIRTVEKARDEAFNNQMIYNTSSGDVYYYTENVA